MTLAPKYYAPLLALLLSGGLLMGAWVSEHVFGYLPCTMCYWQRHVHKAVVIVALMALICARFDMPLRRALTLLLVLLLVGSAGVAFYHSGVEFKWWEGPKTCVSGTATLPDFSGENPFAQLDSKIKPPACDEAVWIFLGLSMATWNGLLSLGGTIATAILGRGRYAKD